MGPKFSMIGILKRRGNLHKKISKHLETKQHTINKHNILNIHRGSLKGNEKNALN